MQVVLCDFHTKDIIQSAILLATQGVDNLSQHGALFRNSLLPQSSPASCYLLRCKRFHKLIYLSILVAVYIPNVSVYGIFSLGNVVADSHGVFVPGDLFCFPLECYSLEQSPYLQTINTCLWYVPLFHVCLDTSYQHLFVSSSIPVRLQMGDTCAS